MRAASGGVPHKSARGGAGRCRHVVREAGS